MKIKIKFFGFVIRVILILILIDSCLNNCDNRSEPILLKESNECVMKYCTEEEFNNKICIKDNDIIRTQWLNNIINFGDKNCRFTKISKYYNGDIIAISQINPGNSFAGYFYGLKENGRPLFIKNGKETPYNPLNNYINSNYNDIEYDESEVLVAKNETTGKEYILIFGKFSGFIELYNFNNKNIDSQQTVYNIIPYFSNEYIINNSRGALFNLKESKYFLYGGVFTRTLVNNNFFVLFKLYYENNTILIEKQSTDIIHSRANMVSCYETEDSEHIFCFFILSISNRNYNIIIFDKDLNKTTPELVITPKFMESNLFLKCIHYEGDKGIFIYYDIINDEELYPIILFKTKNNESIINWNSLSEIKIDSYIFDYTANLNDIIKISNRTICFSSVSQKKEILYIIMINIFDNESKIKIRFYPIRTFQLYNYKLYLDLRLYIYKESIALTSSYCNQTDCENGATHYSSLIIFSYPNSTDYSKNIIDELLEKNEILENLNFSINLGNNMTIENNIFGLIYSKIRIKIIEDCNNIKLISSTKNSEITPNYTLEKDENINITFNNYDIFNCSIWYIYEITEPDYEEFEKYPEEKDISHGNDDEDIFNDYKQTYSGRLSYYNLYLNHKLTNNCSDDCELCYDTIKKKCIVCNNNYNNYTNYTIKTDTNRIKYKTCSEQENEESEKPSDNLDQNGESSIKPKDTTECTIKEIISLLQCTKTIVKSEQFSDLYNQVKEEYLSKIIYTKENIRITTENVILEMTSTDKQDENDPTISFIDLGKCEEILKSKNNIPEDESLIIYKSDIKKYDFSTTYVLYEIYNPLKLEILDLTPCYEEQIKISVPVILNNDTKALYNSLNNSGYNLFDTNDSFYNDICAIYTTENGTDINLNDRQHAIEDNTGSLNFCQEGCTMIDFNNKTQKAECNCNIQEIKNVTNLNDFDFSTKLLNNIFGQLKYSNYLVMKCYKLLYDFELLQKNIGFIFMMIIFISLLVLLLIYIIKGRSKIEYYIQAVLTNKSIYIKNRKELNSNSFKTINNKIPIINSSKNNDEKLEDRIKRLKVKRKSYPSPIKYIKDVKNEKSNHENSSINSSLKNLSKINSVKLKNINIFPMNNLNFIKNKNKKKEKEKEEENALKSKSVKQNFMSLYNLSNKHVNKKHKLKNNKKQKKVLDLDHVNYQTLNIQELNNLQYEIAILIDKRTFFQYYVALIRKKQLIIFTFVPIDDYNLLTLKISSFLLQFSLFMTINALFFSDTTMHQIYTNNGDEDFKYHIPQIIYSSLISIVMNSLLRILSLSENDILSIKQIKSIKSSTRKANEVKAHLSIKFIIFFIVSFILTISCLYFISCFCAVYSNTQVVLIKDSMISFCLSMLYPFGLNIIPGIFRILALRAKKEDKICLYKFSQLISFI